MMEIVLASGIGYGHTTLSAFDAALKEVGIHNFNLLKLSSVIPIGAEVKVVPHYCPGPGEHGYLLYVVLAETRTDRPRTGIAAGLGWYQLADGRGVFAEHSEQAEGLRSAELERGVTHKLRSTIQDLCSHRGWSFDERLLCCQVASCQVEERPASVLVTAVYESRPFAGLESSQEGQGGQR
jgi:arginine decarboxylase